MYQMSQATYLYLAIFLDSWSRSTKLNDWNWQLSPEGFFFWHKKRDDDQVKVGVPRLEFFLAPSFH